VVQVEKAPFTLVLRTPWYSSRQLVPILHLTLPLLGFSQNKSRGPETRRPRCISAVHQNRKQTQLDNKSPRVLSVLLCSFLNQQILSCPLPPRLGRVVSPPRLRSAPTNSTPSHPPAQLWRQRLCSSQASRRPRTRRAAPTGCCSRSSSSSAAPLSLGPSGLRGVGGSRSRPCKRRRRGRPRRPTRSPRSTGSSSASGR
jgi:hypothetical protein